jgi:hypothetical protein
MIQCPNKQNCGKSNPYNARYCAFCGAPLKNLIPSWSNAGGDNQRSSSYPHLDQAPELEKKIQLSMDHSFMEDEDIKDITDLPQPIMAHNVLWIFATRQASLYGIPLTIKDNYLQLEKNKEKFIEAPLNMDDKPAYANTPAYDGIFLNLIYDDKFARISSYDGKANGQELTDSAFENTQKCSPIITEAIDQSSKKIVRYFITGLKEHILIVDISKIGNEAYHLIYWGNKDGKDEIRSPVSDGTNVYFITKNGFLFYVPINVEFNELTKIQEPLSLNLQPGKCHFFAPLIMPPYLISEYFLIHKVHKDCTALFIKDLYQNKRPSRKFLKDASIAYAKSRSYLAGIQVDSYVYYTIRNNIYKRLKPGQGLTKQEFNKKVFPEFWGLNAISVGSRLVVYDRVKNQLIIQETNNTKNNRVIDIHSNIDKKPLCGQPVMFGKVLILYFWNKIVFMNI